MKYDEATSYEKFIIDTWGQPIIRSWNHITEDKSSYEEYTINLLYLRLGNGVFIGNTEKEIREDIGIVDEYIWENNIKPTIKMLTFTAIRKKQ